VTVVQQACAGLAGAIEAGASEAALNALVAAAVAQVLAQTGGEPPHRAILGCTHYPLIEHLFRRHLPPVTRILSQPRVVADSLEDYLVRHPEYAEPDAGATGTVLLTTGNAAKVEATARRFWPDAPAFTSVEV
jgi:glutamate racemase